MSELGRLLLAYLVFMNAAAFVMYGTDKYKAKKQAWRIPENALLMSAVCGGAYGAYLGMHVFHHKTKKPRFFIGVPVMLLLHLVILYFSCPVFFP